MLLAIGLIGFGVLLLFGGAEILVRGASQLALNLGISPLVVGLTVVAFATSMPEAAASLIAQIKHGHGDLALGNVIGSNIANIGLVVGLTSVIRPIPVTTTVVWRESIVMLVVTLLVMGLLFLGPVERWEGAVLLVLLALFIYGQVRGAAKERQRVSDMSVESRQVSFHLFLVLAGSVILVAGGYCLVDGAVTIARLMGVSERVIGLTIVALGTSLPELATSMVAALKGESDISIGNVIGSNIFNLLFILGLVASVAPIEFSRQLLTYDSLVMLGFSLFLWLFVVRDCLVTRREGLLFILGYGLYMASL